MDLLSFCSLVTLVVSLTSYGDFFLWSLAWLSDFTFAMHREFVLSFVWVATASGSAWYEPLLGGVKLPSTELDRLGKDLELMSHKVLCFIAFLPSA